MQTSKRCRVFILSTRKTPLPDWHNVTRGALGEPAHQRIKLFLRRNSICIPDLSIPAASSKLVLSPRVENMFFFFSPVQMHRTQPLRCVELSYARHRTNAQTYPITPTTATRSSTSSGASSVRVCVYIYRVYTCASYTWLEVGEPSALRR